jgi:hypothetical protein
MLAINCTAGRNLAFAIWLVSLVPMPSCAQEDSVGEFRVAVERVMPLFQTNAPLFRTAVNAEKVRQKTKVRQVNKQAETTALDCEELLLLREMSGDINEWGMPQLRVFSEMAIESLAVAGESSAAEMAILCFADIRGVIKSKVIPGYEFGTEINPPSTDKASIGAHNIRLAADSRQRAIRRVDDDMCVALAVHAAEYVRTAGDRECCNRLIRQLSEKNVFSENEIGAVAKGDWKAIFPLRN